MTTGADPSGGPRTGEPQRPPRLSTSVLFVGAAWLLLVVGTVVSAHVDLGVVTRSWVAQGVAVVVLAGLVAVLWEARRWLVRMMTSLPFSVALIAFVLVATALGTVIVQGAPAAAYQERHGRALASVLLALGMDDLFHSPWFQGLLGLMAASLLLTIVARRAWRPSMWGHLLSHLGFVTVLVGGWYGGAFGFKGVIDLHEGQVVDRARIPGKGGPHGENRPLGFGLRLERFVVETYQPEARFSVYERDGDGYRVVRVFEPDDLVEDRPIGASGATVRLVEAYPDFVLEPEVRDAPAGSGAPVLALDVRKEDRLVRQALVAGAPGRDTTVIPGDGPTSLRFVWPTPAEADLARLAEATPETHLIALETEGGEIEEAAVAVGAGVVLPRSGWQLRILEYLPDFSYDSGRKRATTRSSSPNNPAVRVAMVDPVSHQEQVRWLFARMPDFGHGDGPAEGPRFRYRHLPSRRPPARELLVLGEAQEIWRLDLGKVVERRPFAQWRELAGDLPVAELRIHPSAVIGTSPGTRSQSWANPMADLVIAEGGATREVRMAAAHARPVALADGRTFLAFEVRTDEPKAFRSRLTVVEDGAPVHEKTIAVNDPLSWRGHMFYQSSFRKEDPTYSGIQVVRDPGLGVAFAGFLMMALGVVFVYYLRPRVLAWEAKGAAHGD